MWQPFLCQGDRHLEQTEIVLRRPQACMDPACPARPVQDGENGALPLMAEKVGEEPRGRGAVRRAGRREGPGHPDLLLVAQRHDANERHGGASIHACAQAKGGDKGEAPCAGVVVARDGIGRAGGGGTEGIPLAVAGSGVGCRRQNARLKGVVEPDCRRPLYVAFPDCQRLSVPNGTEFVAHVPLQDIEAVPAYQYKGHIPRVVMPGVRVRTRTREASAGMRGRKRERISWMLTDHSCARIAPSAPISQDPLSLPTHLA